MAHVDQSAPWQSLIWWFLWEELLKISLHKAYSYKDLISKIKQLLASYFDGFGRQVSPNSVTTSICTFRGKEEGLLYLLPSIHDSLFYSEQWGTHPHSSFSFKKNKNRAKTKHSYVEVFMKLQQREFQLSSCQCYYFCSVTISFYVAIESGGLEEGIWLCYLGRCSEMWEQFIYLSTPHSREPRCGSIMEERSVARV